VALCSKRHLQRLLIITSTNHAHHNIASPDTNIPPPYVMLSKTFVIALVTASASAAALPSTPTPWLWHVTGATSTCTAATCRYSFNVSAPAGPSGEPGFTATGCFGNSVQGDYKSCATVGIDVPGDVLAQEFNAGIDIGAALSVRFKFTQ
jgi:hypothetical protein